MVIRTAIDGTYAGLRAAGYIIVSRLMESKLSSFIILRADSNYVERDMVFNVAEGMHGLCREAQVPSLPKAYEIPFTFADAATYNRIVFVKGRTKMVLEHFGIHTAPFTVIPNDSEGWSTSQGPD